MLAYVAGVNGEESEKVGEKMGGGGAGEKGGERLR